MEINNFLEIENIISDFTLEQKQKLFSSISFFLINYLNEQNNLELFSIIQKLVSLLNEENKKKLLLEVNNTTIKALFNQGNINIIGVTNKLIGLLNEENHQKILSNIGFLLKNFEKKPLEIERTKRGTGPLPHIPPGNALAEAQAQNIAKGINLNLTTSLSFKPRVKAHDDEYMNPDETIAILKPLLSENGKVALEDILTPEHIKNFLIEINGTNSLKDIKEKFFPESDLQHFIDSINPFFSGKHLSISKNELPEKRMRLKLGEWLAYLGYIAPEKLEKILKLHHLSVKTQSANKRYTARVNMMSLKPTEKIGPYLGEFLLESEVITEKQLEETLLLQKHFNEIVESFN
jgi:hypothetical protein